MIRIPERADLESVAALAILHSGGSPAEWVARFSEDLELGDQRVLLVAEVDEIVVGYGRGRRFAAGEAAPENVAPDGWYLTGLVVAPDWRRRGLGSELTRARLDWISQRAEAAWYFTNARNTASLALHERLGFREVTRDFSFPGVSFDGGVGVLCRAPTGAQGSWREGTGL